MRNAIVWLLAVVVAVFGLVAPADAGHPGTEVFVASVGHGSGSGGTQWRTTLWIHNPNPTPANCQIQLLLRDQANPSPPTFSVSIDPNGTIKYDDATWLLFGVEGYGALRVVASKEVLVNSRIYNQPGGSISDTQGQFFSAVPAGFAIGAGEMTRVLGVNQSTDNDFRYNVGMVETTGNPTSIRVWLYDHDGPLLGYRDYSLAEFEAIQVNVDQLGGGSTPTENGWLNVEVTGGTGKVIVFGSSIANGSNDPSTFEMSLSGSAAVTGAPIAYGHIRSNGTVGAATPNVSCTWDSGLDRYLLTIHGVDYFYSSYATLITPAGSDPCFARTGSVGGDLIVYVFDLSGNKVQQPFSFVVYKP